jgi:lysozyme
MEAVTNDPDNLPPAIDLEFGENCKTDKTKGQIIEEINEFLEMIEEHYKKRPIIYITQEFYKEFLKNDFKEYPIWILNIYSRPKLNGDRDWLIWQYANRGHLNGID